MRVRFFMHERPVGAVGEEHTGVHIAGTEYRFEHGRLTIARIDGKEIETWSFER